MALKKTISGTRGTIGGKAGSNLTPIDIVESTASYGTWLINQGNPKKVIVGRDGRISGSIVSNLAIQTLLSLGIDVIDLDYSTTPTVEMAVMLEKAGGGIIFTASHNPKEWNALKFLNEKGEFISAADGQAILDIGASNKMEFVGVDQLGKLSSNQDYIATHIQHILALDLIDQSAIKARKFKVVADVINSTGAVALPPLFEALGCEFTLINKELTGEFAHNPEPLPKHLDQLSAAVKAEGADLGIAVDPDVDRLAFVCEDGSVFGEEYTLVAIADYVLSKKPGNTVSNLSSTRALSDVTKNHGGQYFASAVGEVNVVNKMKAENAVIGGEGNGGVILPELHYGRDALVGIALMLNHLINQNKTMSALKSGYPSYDIIKNKIEIKEGVEVKEMISTLKTAFKDERLNEEDGLKIDFKEGWVHLRESNTEPIIRVYAEASDADTAANLIGKVNSVLGI